MSAVAWLTGILEGQGYTVGPPIEGGQRRPNHASLLYADSVSRTHTYRLVNVTHNFALTLTRQLNRAVNSQEEVETVTRELREAYHRNVDPTYWINYTPRVTSVAVDDYLTVILQIGVEHHEESL